MRNRPRSGNTRNRSTRPSEKCVQVERIQFQSAIYAMPTMFPIWTCCFRLCFAFTEYTAGKPERLGRHRTRAAQKGQLKRRHRSREPCRSDTDSDSFDSRELCDNLQCVSTDSDSSLPCTCPCVSIRESCVCRISSTDSDSDLLVANSCIPTNVQCSNILSTSTDTDSSDIGRKFIKAFVYASVG